MEVEPIASESGNVAVDVTAKPVDDQGAGDAATSHSERLRRKNKKYARTNSKDGGVSAPTPLPKYRSWKNSRRPRNGHGRGLPKKGKPILYINTFKIIHILPRYPFYRELSRYSTWNRGVFHNSVYYAAGRITYVMLCYRPQCLYLERNPRSRFLRS